MQKHRKHIRRWPKFAAFALAGASLLGITLIAPAKAVPTNPIPVCNGAVCSLSFDVSDEPYLWQASPDAAQVWIEVQGASTTDQPALHWRGQLTDSMWPLQIEHLSNGLIAVRAQWPGPGEFIYAAPSTWNSSWVRSSSFSTLNQLPSEPSELGIITITTVSAPAVRSMTFRTGTGSVSAFGEIEFTQPVTGLDATDFAIWSSNHGCVFENILPSSPTGYTLEVNGCAVSQVSINLLPQSVIGMLPGPLGWYFGTPVNMNVVSAAQPVAPVATATPTSSPAPTPSPVPTTSPTASPVPTTTPEALSIPSPAVDQLTNATPSSAETATQVSTPTQNSAIAIQTEAQTTLTPELSTPTTVHEVTPDTAPAQEVSSGSTVLAPEQTQNLPLGIAEQIAQPRERLVFESLIAESVQETSPGAAEISWRDQSLQINQQQLVSRISETDTQTPAENGESEGAFVVEPENLSETRSQSVVQGTAAAAVLAVFAAGASFWWMRKRKLAS